MGELLTRAPYNRIASGRRIKAALAALGKRHRRAADEAELSDQRFSEIVCARGALASDLEQSGIARACRQSRRTLFRND